MSALLMSGRSLLGLSGAASARLCRTTPLVRGMDGLKQASWNQLRRGMAVYVHKVPLMGESVTEGTISTWQKNVGDQVNEDDVFVTIETDKVGFPVFF